MAELPERWKHYEDRRGIDVIGHLPIRHARRALTNSVPTMDLAVALVDAVAERLGDRGFLDPEGGDMRRRLFVRDADGVIPIPLVTHCWAGTRGEMSLGTWRNEGAVTPADAPEGWEPGDPWFDPERKPDIIPHGPDMRPGDLTIAEGPSNIRLDYDDRGVRHGSVESGCDTYTFARYDGLKPHVIDTLARPPTPRPLSLFLRKDLDPTGHGVDVLAEMVAALDPASRVPVRVRMPFPLPGGIEYCWVRGRTAVRKVLWDGIPADARFLAVDGFDGTAVAWSATREEALARWDQEVRRVKPKPPGWKPEPEKEEPEIPDDEGPTIRKDESGKTIGFSSGVIRLSAPAIGLQAWPIPLPQNVPVVVLPVPQPPPVPDGWREAGFDRWMPIVGDTGQIGWGLYRADGEGWTLVGDGVFDVLDPTTIDVELDASDAKEMAFYAEASKSGFPDSWTDPLYHWRMLQYRVWDEGWQKRIPARSASGAFTQERNSPANLNEMARWMITRHYRREGRHDE